MKRTLFYRTLLYFWQLPQDLVGFILSLYCSGHVAYVCNDSESMHVYTCKLFYSAVSLGDIVIADSRIFLSYKTINHEHGHQKQSRILGPLYLIVIGLPSLLGNIYSRLFHKSADWYYKQPWEAWADKLGGVKR